MARVEPTRGDLFEGDLNPVVGREQRGRRPVLVVSIDPMNRAPAELVIVLPVTTTPRENLFHVRIDPGESGLSRVSYAMPEMVRSISTLRLGRRMGRVRSAVADAAARNAGVLLGLGETR